MIDRVNQRLHDFRAEVGEYVGSEVTVHTVLAAPRSYKGLLMRVAPEGLVISGLGIVPVEYIEDVTASGHTIRVLG